MRANGTRTSREINKEVARINAQISAVQDALDNFAADLSGTALSDAMGDAWNALHDAVTALEAERRTVELNAPCDCRYMDATAILIAENRD